MTRAKRIEGIDPESSLRANAALIIPVRVRELTAWEQFIEDPDRIFELHQMRIAAKRLRYTMELFAPFYVNGLAAAIERIKAIQELLGKIHDADVLVPQLLDHLRATLQPRGKKKRDKGPEVGVHGADFDAAAGLLALCRSKRDEREDLYGKFLALWRRLRASGFFESLTLLVLDENRARFDQVEGALPQPAPNGHEEETPDAKVKVNGRGAQAGRPARKRDPGARPDTRASAREGGLDRHNGAEEGDPH